MDKILKIGFILLMGVIWIFIGWVVINSFLNGSETHKNAPQSPEMPRDDTYYLIEQNSLKAIIPPYLTKPQVLGVIMGDPLLEKLAFCESSLNPNAYNPKDPITPSIGLFQFKEQTWNLYCEGNIWNADDQIKCVSKMLEMGLGNQHWKRCWNKINYQ